MASPQDSNDLSELLADALNDFTIEDNVEKSTTSENKPVQESMEDVLKMLNKESTNDFLPSNDEDLEKMFHEFANNFASNNANTASADHSNQFFTTFCLLLVISLISYIYIFLKIL